MPQVQCGDCAVISGVGFTGNIHDDNNDDDDADNIRACRAQPGNCLIRIEEQR